MAESEKFNQNFHGHAPLGDQDIIYQYFQQHPDEWHELPCQWNFQPLYPERRNMDISEIAAKYGTAYGPQPLHYIIESSTFSRNLLGHSLSPCATLAAVRLWVANLLITSADARMRLV